MIVTAQVTFDDPVVDVSGLVAPAAAYTASGRTPGGLPYPTQDDKLSQTATYIGELADAARKMVDAPGLVVAVGSLTTAADGRVWITFSKLSVLNGLVVQVMTGGWQIFPKVIQRSGNSGLVQFPYAPFNVNDSVVKNFVGTLTAFTWAWGTAA